MDQRLGSVSIASRGRGLYEFTREAADFVRESGFETGLLTLFCRHTSASLLIQENADPDVRADLEAFFQRIAPEQPGLYRHDSEGPDDMPAHIRAALTQTQLSVPVSGGRMTLGAWQGLYLFEHRRAPQRRVVTLHLLGR
ncbi:MAG TPA: secondary thiamine-phosphate synthase enzyme YjbQ [Caulobacteraceae bacterium]|nr:secondary thiamine-phosphate synthase enzyme YjbQ [Caulobacteraceae bacterium]